MLKIKITFTDISKRGRCKVHYYWASDFFLAGIQSVCETRLLYGCCMDWGKFSFDLSNSVTCINKQGLAQKAKTYPDLFTAFKSANSWRQIHIKLKHVLSDTTLYEPLIFFLTIWDFYCKAYDNQLLLATCLIFISIWRQEFALLNAIRNFTRLLFE